MIWEGIYYTSKNKLNHTLIIALKPYHLDDDVLKMCLSWSWLYSISIDVNWILLGCDENYTGHDLEKILINNDLIFIYHTPGKFIIFGYKTFSKIENACNSIQKPLIKLTSIFKIITYFIKNAGGERNFINDVILIEGDYFFIFRELIDNLCQGVAGFAPKNWKTIKINFANNFPSENTRDLKSRSYDATVLYNTWAIENNPKKVNLGVSFKFLKKFENLKK